MTGAERRMALLSFCEIFSVEGINRKRIIEALMNNEFPDFEDYLQLSCARNFYADYIITRNEKDYATSEIPAISSKNFCDNFMNFIL